MTPLEEINRHIEVLTKRLYTPARALEDAMAARAVLLATELLRAKALTTAPTDAAP